MASSQKKKTNTKVAQTKSSRSRKESAVAPEAQHPYRRPAGALVCLLLVPGLERHFRTKQERMEHWFHLVDQIKK